MATNNAINAPFPFTVVQGGSGVATIPIGAIVTGDGTAPIDAISLDTEQLLLGTGVGSAPVAVDLAGVGGSWSFDSMTSTLTFTVSGGTATVEVTGTTQTISVGTIYIANNGSGVAFTLPTTAAIGESFEIIGKGAGGWSIVQNASQLIHLGNLFSTTGVSGSFASTNQWDCIVVKCITADNVWQATSAIGNITIV